MISSTTTFWVKLKIRNIEMNIVFQAFILSKLIISSNIIPSLSAVTIGDSDLFIVFQRLSLNDYLIMIAVISVVIGLLILLTYFLKTKTATYEIGTK